MNQSAKRWLVLVLSLFVGLVGWSQSGSNCGFGASMTSNNAGQFMFCPGGALQLQAIPNSTSSFTYQWFEQGNALVQSTSPNYVINQPGTYIVVITRLVPLCVDTVTQTVGQFSIPLNPTFNLPTQFTEVCLTSSSFALSGGSGASGSGVYFSTAFNSIISGNYVPGALTPQVDTIKYIHTYSNGCRDTADQTITIHGRPTLTLPTTRPQFCEGDTNEVKLSFATGTDNAIGPILSDSVWYNGPGVINPKDSSFRPSVAGAAGFKNIQARYKVTYPNANSCIVTRTQSIRILRRPTVNISPGTPRFICRDTSFSVVTNPALGNGQGFLYGYGVTDTLNGLFNADSAYNKLGGSDDTLTFVYTDVNGCSNSDQYTVQIFDLPNVTFQLNDTICEDVKNRKLIEGLPSGGDYAIQNTLGGYNPLSGDFLYPVQEGAGLEILRYTYKDVNSCVNEAFDTIDIKSLPTVTLPQPLAAQYCENNVDTIILNMGLPTGGFYGGNGVKDDTLFIETLGVGDFPVYYTYVDSFGCANRDTSDIRINAAPSLAFPNLDDVCLSDTTIDLTDPAIGVSPLVPGAIFRGEGITGTALYLDSLGITDSTVSTVVDSLWYIYTDPVTSCTDSARSKITIRPIPQAQIEDKSSVCEGVVTDLMASGGLVYRWSNGDTNATAAILQDSTTTYVVTVANVYGCSAIDSVTLGLITPSSVTASYDSVGFLMNQSADLDPSLNDIGDFAFVDMLGQPTNGQANMLDDFTIEYTPEDGFRRPDTVPYAVCDIVCPNVCDSSFVIFNVLGDPYEFIPNGFSPDGDGLNDVWRVPGIELFPQNELLIYNRWGDLIYQASPYLNEWEGQSNTGISVGSGSVIDGTYLYVLKTGAGEPITGTIELKSR